VFLIKEIEQMRTCQQCDDEAETCAFVTAERLCAARIIDSRRLLGWIDEHFSRTQYTAR
jgi:hypothetical protein